MERAIEASTIIGARPGAVVALLAAEPSIAMPNPLTLSVGGAHQDVTVVLDETVVEGLLATVGVAWRSREHEHLLPSFDGTLSAEPSVGGTRLRLVGHYRVPLGPVGRFGDGLIGRRAAHESLRDALGDVARRVDHAVGAGADLEYDVALTEHSEIYIG